MVLAGQFLERPTLIARSVADQEAIALEGLFHRGDRPPATVICAPHPRLGGSMDSPVVAELAWALTQSGRATLRFNYQGVGASPGQIHSAPAEPQGRLPLADLDSEAGDAAAAVTHLRESVSHGRAGIAGYSYGAAVALSLATKDPGISHLILIAPPTGLFDFSPIASVRLPILVVAGQRDAWVDRVELSGLLSALPNVRWEVIVGADHFFSRGLTELGRLVTGWLDGPASRREG
jgi:alpha/beta superfamily hydrolase